MTERPFSETAGRSIQLFNGVNLNGWRQAGPGRFRIEDGMLVTEGGMGLLWYSARQFGNFELQVDWRVTKKSDNSGIFVRFPAPTVPNEAGGDPQVAINQGYEIQIDDMGFNVDTGQNFSPLHQTGAVYGLTPSSAIASKPAGQWNTFEIEATDAAISVTLNGQLVSTYLIQANDGRRREGHIGLQCHRQRAIPERDDPVFA